MKKAQLDDILKTLNAGTDLSVVLCCTAFLDQVLAIWLRKSLRKSSVTEKSLNPNKGGFLADIQKKIDLLYILEKFDKDTYHILCCMVRIRNKFGHSPIEGKLDEPEVVELIDELWKLGKKNITILDPEDPITNKMLKHAQMRCKCAAFPIIKKLEKLSKD